MIDLIRGSRNLAGATPLALAIAMPATAAPEALHRYPRCINLA